MKYRPCQSYNDCPTYTTLPSLNPCIFMGECRCGIRKYYIFRVLYWYMIYPIGKLLFNWYEQEWVMRKLNKDIRN